MKVINLKKNRGFTLLEALVAVSILMVAVSAPITIAQKGLSSAVYSKDQMVASYLAQDAIEYIKNKRDNVTMNSDTFDWADLWDGDTGLGECLRDDGCRIDTIDNSIRSFSSGEYLRKNPTTGFYQYTDGDNTRFTRQIKITKKDPSEAYEALVAVTVRWGENLVSVYTLIYNY
jgi:Tfp pilus assembly protein PilV